jgi:hypothetical protein
MWQRTGWKLKIYKNNYLIITLNYKYFLIRLHFENYHLIILFFFKSHKQYTAPTSGAKIIHHVTRCSATQSGGCHCTPVSSVLLQCTQWFGEQNAVESAGGACAACRGRIESASYRTCRARAGSPGAWSRMYLLTLRAFGRGNRISAARPGRVCMAQSYWAGTGSASALLKWTRPPPQRGDFTMRPDEKRTGPESAPGPCGSLVLLS